MTMKVHKLNVTSLVQRLCPGSRIERVSPWIHVRPVERSALPDFGWKLHISSNGAHFDSMLHHVVPLLFRHRVVFKVVQDYDTLRHMSSGGVGATQVGKVMTIYPHDDSEAVLLARDLRVATQGMEGPEVLTDLRLGDVIYARHGTIGGSFRKDRFHRTTRQVTLSDGSIVTDEYAVPFELPNGVHNPFSEMTREYVHADQHSDALIAAGYLFSDLIQKGATGSVFLGFDLRDQSTAGLRIIKEGRAWCMEDGYGRDARARLRHEAKVLQELRGAMRLPAPDDYFEFRKHGYLPLEYLEDVTQINEHLRKKGAMKHRKDVLLDFVRQLQKLHLSWYVHRDLSSGNVMVTSENEVRLIDFELSARVQPTEPPFGGGTPGFSPPEQFAGALPAFSQDVYAFGNIVLHCLDSGASNLRWGLLELSSERRSKAVKACTGLSDDFAQVISACLDHDPARRPRLEDIERTITAASDDLVAAPKVLVSVPKRPDSKPSGPDDGSLGEEVERALAGCVVGLLRGPMVDKTSGLWVSANVDRSQRGKQQQVNTVYRSANRGVAGILYTLARLHRCGFDVQQGAAQIEYGIDWLLSEMPTPDLGQPGLHFGEAGVAVAVAEVVASGLIADGPWVSKYLAHALNGVLDWPDVTHGAAGQGIASLACAGILGAPSITEHAVRCAEHLCETQREDGSWILPPGVDGMSGKYYTGFAHGVAGIVYFLAAFADVKGDERALNAALAGARWLQHVAKPLENGAMAWPVAIGDDDRWNWWCHGAPGIALTFMKLSQVTGSQAFADVAHSSLDGRSNGLRALNLSQCHGVSGLGDIYNEATRILGKAGPWSGRAESIAREILSCAHPTDDGGLTWFVEDTTLPTADLCVGSAGVAHFLLRLTSAGMELGAPLLVS